MKTLKAGETEYTIYLRITGFQEKEAFYELYAKPPRFDTCGKSTIPSIADVHVDETKGTATALVLINKTLKIEYDRDTQSQPDLKTIPIKVEKNN